MQPTAMPESWFVPRRRKRLKRPIPAPTHAQQLEIARRVHATFEQPKRWHRGGWGLDDHGDLIRYDSELYVPVATSRRKRPDLAISGAHSPLCLCLGTAILVHCAGVLDYNVCAGHDPSLTRDATEAMCALYTKTAGIDTSPWEQYIATFDPHRGSLVGWNDADGRTHEDVRALTGAVVRHLEAQAPGIA